MLGSHLTDLSAPFLTVYAWGVHRILCVSRTEWGSGFMKLNSWNMNKPNPSIRMCHVTTHPSAFSELTMIYDRAVVKNVNWLHFSILRFLARDCGLMGDSFTEH